MSPLYSYQCPYCPHSGRQEMRLISERYSAPECAFCKRSMVLEVGPVRGIVKNPAVPKRVK